MSSTIRLAVTASVLACVVSSRTEAQETKVEEVIVTSTALRENPLEVAQPTTVLAGDDLRRQIAASLGETLSSELGVSSTYFGPAASRPVIRGLAGYRVQTLQDGLASLDVSGLSQDHAVTLESVVSQQIEIIKGPAALLYGSGAAGGLVNVVSNRIPLAQPPKPLNATAELRGDTASAERTKALSLEGSIAALHVHADYFDRDTDDVEIPGFAQSAILRRQLLARDEQPDGARGHIANTSSDTNGGALGAALEGDAARGGVAWSRYDSVYGIPGEDTAFIDMSQDRYDAKAELDLDGRFTALHLDGSYNQYTHTEFEAPGEPGTVFEQDAYDLRFTADHELDNGWRGTAGLQYADIDFQATGEEAYVPASKTTARSLFLFEERHFDPWTLELGARAEQQKIALAGPMDYDATAFSASAGVVWNFTEDQAVALNLTRTQRNPQAAELYANGAHIAAHRFEIGDPALDKETALTADLSLRRSAAPLQWTVNLFYNDYQDYIYENPTGALAVIEDGADTLPVFQYQQASAKFYGMEAELRLPLLASARRHLELRLSSDYVRGKLDNGTDLPQIPPLRVGAGLHYDRGDWHIGSEIFRYDSQDHTAGNELPTAGCTLLDADASYRLTIADNRLLIFLRASNLLDAEARQHSSPLKDIAPLPGRSLHVGVRGEF